jgi:hypothetical protein
LLRPQRYLNFTLNGSLASFVAESSFAEPLLFAEPLVDDGSLKQTDAELSLVAEPLFAPWGLAAQQTSNQEHKHSRTLSMLPQPLLGTEHLFADGPLEPVLTERSFAEPSFVAEPNFAQPLFAEPLFAKPSLVPEPLPRPHCRQNSTTNGSSVPTFAEPLFAEPSLVVEPLCADGSLELIVAEPWLAKPSFAERRFANSLSAEPLHFAEHSPRPQCRPNATLHAPGRETQAQPNPHSVEDHSWPWPDDPASSPKHTSFVNPCAQPVLSVPSHTAPCLSVAPQRKKDTYPDTGQILATTCRATQPQPMPRLTEKAIWPWPDDPDLLRAHFHLAAPHAQPQPSFTPHLHAPWGKRHRYTAAWTWSGAQSPFAEPLFAEPSFAEPSLVTEPLFAEGSLELTGAELSFAEPLTAPRGAPPGANTHLPSLAFH